jgi:hypothetical protein
MAFDSCKQLAKNRSQRKCGKRNRNRRDDCPKQKGVPLPHPELANENQGMFPRRAKEFVGRERHRRSMEDAARGMNERNHQEEFERIDNVVANLRGRYVETEDKGERKAKYSRASEDGIDADEESGSNAPGQLLRRGPHAQQRKDWKSHPAIDPVVVNGRVTLSGMASIWFAGVHF